MPDTSEELLKKWDKEFYEKCEKCQNNNCRQKKRLKKQMAKQKTRVCNDCGTEYVGTKKCINCGGKNTRREK